jgi:hypothetical protein
MAYDAARSMPSGATPEAAPATDAAAPAVDAEKGAFSGAAMWPWQMMQQMREQMQQSAAAAEQATSGDKPAGKSPARRTRK